MDEKQSGSCLAEIRGVEDKDLPSGRSTRASLAKLPKISVFSSSIKSVNSESPHSEPDDSHEQRTKSASKPPTRQGAEKKSTLNTQQLEICINLSEVLDSTQAVTPKREETPKREKAPKRQATPKKEETSKGSKSNKSAALSAQNDPPIWEQSSTKRAKGERPRTKTWPALRYKLWLDSSNLPLHLLCNDERANRQQHLLLSQVAKKRAESSRPGSSSNSSKLSMPSDHGKSSNEWSVKFLSISRPPFRPDKKNNNSNILDHKSEEERKRAEETALFNGLKVGAGESWHVATSYVHKPRPESHGSQGHKSIGRLRSIDGVDSPQVGKGTYPRIPSRMGPNNFEAFLKQNTTLVDVSHSHSGDSIPGLQTNLSPSPSKLPYTIISPRYFCNTSTEVSLLTLRSYARNPRMLQEFQVERNRDINPAVMHQNEVTGSELERDGVRHVRFKVPCGNSEDMCNDLKQVTLVARKQKSGMGNQILSDVTPPPTPPNLDRAFRISVLPHF